MGGKRAGQEPMGFGPILKALREAKGMSQQALAAAAGMNLWSVAKMEQGQREPSWRSVVALSAALDVTPNDFLPPAAKKPKGKK